MSYTPTDWKTGDVITADKLNNMEQGIVDSEMLLITATNVASQSTPQTTPTLDKTFLEIADAIKAGKVPLLKMVTQSGFVYFAKNVSVIYSGDDVLGVVFNLLTTALVMDGTVWNETNTVVVIYSDMVSSTFYSVNLTPTA